MCPLPPGVKLRQKISQLKSTASFCGLFQLNGALLEEGPETRQVAASEMVKCRGDLDQAVEKNLFFVRGLQPQGFQGFVGLEEFPGVE